MGFRPQVEDHCFILIKNFLGLKSQDKNVAKS